MTNVSLRTFCDRAIEKDSISKEDVRELQRDILVDGLISREVADRLLALDRTVAVTDPSWADFLVASLVEFVVWTSRPTGSVDRKTARWLIRSLSGGQRPTATGLRAALEIINEGHEVDRALLAFVEHAGQRRSHEACEIAAPARAA